ncbi:uncharacterized protein CBL_04503 [Carabus blaptoides fortunei]
MLSLSEHDRAVLNCVFNPHLPSEQAYEHEDIPELKDEEFETPEVLETRDMEVTAVKKTEEGNFKDAIVILTKAIDALSDVSMAIDLSDGKGKTGCQALCQRALLHRKAGRTELARDDFSAAASLGSKFAKTQLIEMNPYAALCNQMLQQVLHT